ncbi:MAG: DUF302 domain-containing protein [Sandaracinus sp.]|nr:DUF302 domain-containing protein [Sandaracinus sp.]
MTNDSLRRELPFGFDEALERLPAALQSEGFGALTEIDVQATLKKKLDVDFRRYRIVGACNPKLAHAALGVSLDVGVMLPCNVVVYETDDGKTVALAVDPMKRFAAEGPPGLESVAADVEARLVRVLDHLAG